jgi:hypothetical protein
MFRFDSVTVTAGNFTEEFCGSDLTVAEIYNDGALTPCIMYLKVQFCRFCDSSMLV